jgi:hypothetical protein
MQYGLPLDGFTAITTIFRAYISGGLDDDGKQFNSGHMEMEGKVVHFYYGSLKETLRQKTRATAIVHITFTEYGEEPPLPYDPTRYIGYIREWEENNEVTARIDVNLPLSMYLTLQSMKGEDIKIDTIHDLINEQNEDSIVAFIKRIYFEVQPVKEDDRSGKRFSISIG